MGDAPSKAVLVLGASGGLGSVIAEGFLEKGARVALTYRRPSSTVDEILSRHKEARSYQLDLGDEEACRRVVDSVATDFGGIDVVIYAAGPHVPMMHLSKVSPTQFREQILDDAVAFFNAVHPSLPHLRETHGNIVAVTTAATSRYPVRDGLSSGPKGAVEALVRAIARRRGTIRHTGQLCGTGNAHRRHGRTTDLVGDIDERALEAARANIPLRRFGTAADIAEAVLFLSLRMMRDSSRVRNWNVDGGFST